MFPRLGSSRLPKNFRFEAAESMIGFATAP